jgi:hypothetical protein
MVPRGEHSKHDNLDWYCNIVKQCSDFHEMTGKIGDVVLMHPLMAHSASRNSLRIPRIITNPPVSLNESFNFNRENPEGYSLVELKTLQALGKKRLQGWQATGPRERIVPERMRNVEEMRKFEMER